MPFGVIFLKMLVMRWVVAVVSREMVQDGIPARGHCVKIFSR